MNESRSAPFAASGWANSAACGLANVAALCCIVVGCSQSAIAPKSATLDRVENSLVDRAEFDAVLARFAGQVVLVDGWATWCGPCVEQLPHSVSLADKYRDQGLAVVTLNFDDPDAAGQVRRVLAAAGAAGDGVTNLQSKLGGSSASMNAFEINSGALPHYRLFDRKGKLRHTFELDPSAKMQFTAADVDAAVAQLLAE